MQFVAVLAFLAITANFCLAQNGDEPSDGGIIFPNEEEVDADLENSVSSDRTPPAESLSETDISSVTRQLEYGDIDSFPEDRAEGDETEVASRDELVAISDPNQVYLNQVLEAANDPLEISLMLDFFRNVKGDFKEEPAGDAEIIFPNEEEVDADFQKSVVNDRTRPAKGLSTADISRVAKQLAAGKIDNFAEDRAVGDKTEVSSRDELVRISDPKQVNLYLQAFQAARVAYYKCCPSVQSYQCGVNHHNLTSFYQWPYGWCFPLHNAYYVSCNCGKCFIFCKDCVHEGKCLPRYTYKSFVALCWNWKWVKPIYFKKYLRTTCYCSANCPQVL